MASLDEIDGSLKHSIPSPKTKRRQESNDM